MTVGGALKGAAADPDPVQGRGGGGIVLGRNKTTGVKVLKISRDHLRIKPVAAAAAAALGEPPCLRATYTGSGPVAAIRKGALWQRIPQESPVTVVSGDHIALSSGDANVKPVDSSISIVWVVECVPDPNPVTTPNPGPARAAAGVAAAEPSPAAAAAADAGALSKKRTALAAGLDLGDPVPSQCGPLHRHGSPPGPASSAASASTADPSDPCSSSSPPPAATAAATKKTWDVPGQELVVMVGPPGAGKSRCADARFVAAGYTLINRDSIGDMKRCRRMAGEALRRGESVVVDNTNPSVQARGNFVSLVDELGLSGGSCGVRACWVRTDRAVAEALNALRTGKTPKGASRKVPPIAFSTYYKNFHAPDARSEGITQGVLEVAFEPAFTDPELETSFNNCMAKKQRLADRKEAKRAVAKKSPPSLSAFVAQMA